MSGPYPLGRRVSINSLALLALLANVIGPMIRGHWAVENCLHWITAMVFRDDVRQRMIEDMTV